MRQRRHGFASIIAFVYAVGEGLGKGLREAGRKTESAIGLGTLALAATGPELDEWVARERGDG